MNKDKAIEEAMASIENRIRDVYNQGFEKGYAKGKEKPTDEYEIVKEYCDSRCLTLVDSTYLQCLAGFVIVPSAQQWIPCSKGLPEIDEETGESILCNVTLKNGNVTADFRSVYNGDNWYNYGSSVVAWMPLPEPYKEEKE